uniref:D7 salivary protein n=1 Tax=Nyssomyia intermedia TaxID=182990 RepID=J7HHV8_9DIPT
MIIWKVLLLFNLCRLGYSWQDVRNADQSLWAYKSCMRDPKDVDLVPKWRKFIFPNDERTQCYVKCLWTRLGAYNQDTKSFNTDRIAKQFASQGLSVPDEINYLQGIAKGCKAVYDKSMKFFKSQGMAIRTAYYATNESEEKWFNAHPDTKPKGPKISTFCKSKGDGGCEHSCSFYYFRLIDEDNLIIPFSDLPGYPKSALEECRNQVKSTNGCKSSELYECLSKADKPALDSALEQLDNWSERY